MQDYGLVSIITPSYNTAGFIAETIRSVQSQTYPNWEMIIVDDCSSDSTDEVVKPFLAADKRIKYVKNDRNSGAAISRNRALKMAQGKWVAFLSLIMDMRRLMKNRSQQECMFLDYGM